MQTESKGLNIDNKIRYIAYSSVEKVGKEYKEVHSFYPVSRNEKGFFQHSPGPNRQMRRQSKKNFGRMNTKGTYRGFSVKDYKSLDEETQKDLWEKRKIKLAMKGKPFLSKVEKEEAKKKSKSKRK